MTRSIDRSRIVYTKIVHNILDESKHPLMETENVTIDLSDFGIFEANNK